MFVYLLKTRLFKGQPAPDWIFYDDMHFILGCKDKYNVELGHDSIFHEGHSVEANFEEEYLEEALIGEGESVYCEPDVYELTECNENDSNLINLPSPAAPSTLTDTVHAETSRTTRRKRQNKEMESLVDISKKNNEIMEKMLKLEQERDKREEREEALNSKVATAMLMYLECQTNLLNKGAN